MKNLVFCDSLIFELNVQIITIALHACISSSGYQPPFLVVIRTNELLLMSIKVANTALANEIGRLKGAVEPEILYNNSTQNHTLIWCHCSLYHLH